MATSPPVICCKESDIAGKRCQRCTQKCSCTEAGRVINAASCSGWRCQHVVVLTAKHAELVVPDLLSCCDCLYKTKPRQERVSRVAARANVARRVPVGLLLVRGSQTGWPPHRVKVVPKGSKYALYLEIVLAVRSVQGSCREYRALSSTSSVMADKVHFEKLG